MVRDLLHMREFTLQESIATLSAQVASVQADVKMLVKQFEDVDEERESRKAREREKEKERRRGKSPYTGHDKQARSISALPGARVQEHCPRREESPFRQIVGNVDTYMIEKKVFKSDADSHESKTNQPDSNAARQEEQLAFERAIHASSVLPWVGVVAGGSFSPLTAASVLVSGPPGRGGGEASTVQDSVNRRVLKDPPRRSSLPPPVM